MFFEATKMFNMRSLQDLAAWKLADQFPSLDSVERLAAERLIPSTFVKILNPAFSDTWTPRYSCMCFLRNTDSYLPSATLQCVHKNMLQILETKTFPLLSGDSPALVMRRKMSLPDLFTFQMENFSDDKKQWSFQMESLYDDKKQWSYVFPGKKPVSVVERRDPKCW